MPTSTSVTTVQRRSSSSSAKKVSLAHIDKYDAGLVGVEGAREVISLISSRRNVTKLTLGHNKLGEDGASELFRFLSSESGRKHMIAEVTMNSNYMGDKGMAAMAEYIEGNEHLRELSLQNNDFMGDPGAVLSFVNALNTSFVESLNLDTNHELSDSFMSLFLSHLKAPHLRVLHLSTIGLSSASSPHIVAFLTSPRSQSMETFKCNGNNLGLISIQSIVSGLLKTNATLQRTEFIANYAPEEAREDGRNPSRRKMWEEAEAGLKKFTARNALLKKKVADEAVKLLPYARALLMRSGRGEIAMESAQRLRATSRERYPLLKTNSSPTLSSLPRTSLFSFSSLPLELQHHVLSFLAPLLSPSQLIHVFAYASSPSTLPPILPDLRGGHGCMPDPASMPFMLLGGGRGFGPRPAGGRPRGASVGGCSGGTCMGTGSVSCHRNRERVKWLNEVGCRRCDVKEGTDVEAWAVVALGSAA